MNHIYQLTPAEQEVSELLRNNSIAAVARLRGVAYQTVKAQKASIADKHEALRLLTFDLATRPRVYTAPHVATWMPWKMEATT